MRSALPLLLLPLAVSLCGCSLLPPRAVKPVQVEVVKYVKQEVPSKLTDPLLVSLPTPLCIDPQTRKPVYCNGQTSSIIVDLAGIVGTCNLDRWAIKESQVVDSKGKSK